MKNRLVSFALIILFILLSSCAKTEQPLSAAEFLDLGEKYLLEMSYEQALVQFTSAIEVEPMNPRGYTGAAEAYVAQGQTDKALEVLQRGYEVTGDALLLAAIEAMQTETSAVITPVPATEPPTPIPDSGYRVPAPPDGFIPLTPQDFTLASLIPGVSTIEEAAAVFGGEIEDFSSDWEGNVISWRSVSVGGSMDLELTDSNYARQVFGDPGINVIRVSDPIYAGPWGITAGDSLDDALRFMGLEPQLTMDELNTGTHISYEYMGIQYGLTKFDDPSSMGDMQITVVYEEGDMVLSLVIHNERISYIVMGLRGA